MKRPFLLMLILLIVNIFFISNFSYIVALLVIFIVTSLLVFIFDYKVVILSILVILISFFVLHTIEKDVTSFHGEVILSGRVIEYGINSEDSFVLKTEDIRIDSVEEKFQCKVLVNFKEDYSYLIGQDIVLKTSLEIPFKNTNPNMFNYRKYLRSLGIDYISNISHENILRVSNKKFSIAKSIYNFRKKLSNHFESVYSKNTLAFIKGFIYGDKSDFNKDELNAFYNVGLGHILVVSGLHFGIMFLILQWLLTKFKVNQVSKLLIINIVLLLFLAVTGFKISSIRAYCMIILLESIYLFDRRLDILNFLSFLSIIIILINPFSIYSVSFLLSFGAIFSIAFFYNKINQVLPSFVSIVLSVQVIIGLINIHIFNQINFATLIINIPINIVVVILYVLILLNIILHPIHILTLVITKIIAIIFSFVEFLDKQTFFKFILPSFSSLQLLLIISLLLMLVLVYEKEKFSYKSLIYLILSGSIIISSVSILNESIEIFFYDVKSGDSIFISTPRKNKVLIDTGRDDSYNLIGDILLKSGNKDIDLLFLTHNHNDHTGGLESLLEKHRIKNLFLSKHSELVIALNKYQPYLENTNIVLIESGDQVVYDGIVFNILNPKGDSLSVNNQSLVLDVRYKSYKMLFTGDIEKEIEAELMDQLSSNYDLLKVPHHGSLTSSTKIFLDKVKPLYSVIQVGKNNYGHPDSRVLKRYDTLKSKVLRNDLDGAIIFRLDEKIEFETLIME